MNEREETTTQKSTSTDRVTQSSSLGTSSSSLLCTPLRTGRCGPQGTRAWGCPPSIEAWRGSVGIDTPEQSRHIKDLLQGVRCCVCAGDALAIDLPADDTSRQVLVDIPFSQQIRRCKTLVVRRHHTNQQQSGAGPPSRPTGRKERKIKKH